MILVDRLPLLHGSYDGVDGANCAHATGIGTWYGAFVRVSSVITVPISTTGHAVFLSVRVLLLLLQGERPAHRPAGSGRCSLICPAHNALPTVVASVASTPRILIRLDDSVLRVPVLARAGFSRTWQVFCVPLSLVFLSTSCLPSFLGRLRPKAVWVYRVRNCSDDVVYLERACIERESCVMGSAARRRGYQEVREGWEYCRVGGAGW